MIDPLDKIEKTIQSYYVQCNLILDRKHMFLVRK